MAETAGGPRTAVAVVAFMPSVWFWGEWVGWSVVVQACTLIAKKG